MSRISGSATCGDLVTVGFATFGGGLVGHGVVLLGQIRIGYVFVETDIFRRWVIF